MIIWGYAGITLLALLLHFIHAPVADLLLVALFASGGYLLYRKQNSLSPQSVPKADHEEDPLEQWEDVDDPSALVATASGVIEKQEKQHGYGALDRRWQKGQWDLFEKSMDVTIEHYITLVYERFNPDSVAFFFPETESSFTLKQLLSKTPGTEDSCLLHKGEGLLGALVKEHVLPRRFTTDGNQQQLPYYTEQLGPREAILAPVNVLDDIGFLVVDRPKGSGFDEKELLLLSTMSDLMGETISHGYLYHQHEMMHEKVTAISRAESSFLAQETVEALFDKLVEVLKFATPFDRLSVSLKVEKSLAQLFQEKGGVPYGVDLFALDGEGLVPLVFRKAESFSRNYSPQRYEFRYNKTEKQQGALGSFVGIPMIVGEVVGVVFLESYEENAFSTPNIAILERLISAAGVSFGRLRLLEQTNNIAIRDGLTGLYNHRQFQTLLAESIARSHRLRAVHTNSRQSSDMDKTPVALVLSDIDFFKKCNDLHGHQFGDKVLKEVAKTLDDGVRVGVDFAARYGGEEFALILYGSDRQSAFDAVDRLRKSIEALQFRSPKGVDVIVTMSFGIAFYDEDAQRQEELISKADKALYKAKENGRNRVEFYRS